MHTYAQSLPNNAATTTMKSNNATKENRKLRNVRSAQRSREKHKVHLSCLTRFVQIVLHYSTITSAGFASNVPMEDIAATNLIAIIKEIGTLSNDSDIPIQPSPDFCSPVDTSLMCGSDAEGILTTASPC